jgi:hypothetical protein
MTPILNPAVPASAYDQFLAGALPRARAQQVWTPADRPLPALWAGTKQMMLAVPGVRGLLLWTPGTLVQRRGPRLQICAGGDRVWLGWLSV